MAVVHPENLRPLRPRVVAPALVGRARHELEVGDRARSMADGSRDAVRASVAATDDNDVLVLGGQQLGVGPVVDGPVLNPGGGGQLALGLEGARVVVEEGLLCLCQELHGVVDAIELVSLDWQRPGRRGAGRNQNSVVLVPQVLQREGGPWLAHAHTKLELHALGRHEVETALHDALVELHVRDAIHQQPPSPGRALQDGHAVAHAVELISSSQAGGATANDSDADVGAGLGRAGADGARLPAPVGDGVLDVLDGDRLSDKAGDARSLTGRWAHAAGELGEGVGAQEPVQGAAVIIVVDQSVPLRNEVVDGAAGVGVAVGRAAIHAPLCLLLPFRRMLLDGLVNLAEILEAVSGRSVGLGLALQVHKGPQRVLGRLGGKAATGSTEGAALRRLGGARCRDGLRHLGGGGGGGGGVHAGRGLVGRGCGSRRGRGRGGSSQVLKRNLVVDGHDLHELRKRLLPVVKHALGHGAVRALQVLLDVPAELRGVVIADVGQLSKRLLGVGLGGQLPIRVVHPSDPSTHARRKVAPDRAQDDTATARHVLKTVVAHAFNHSHGAAVTDGKTLAGLATEERLASYGAVQGRVAADDVGLRHVRAAAREGVARVGREHAAAQTLAGTVIDLALDLELHAARQEGADRLASRAHELDLD
mmetsp:Transcript_25040/g.57656  ORF Transcript_25040/g.57656 Transcript_25040/m.57656 type:complete len:649 (-) Transcript_25040:4165-6111(-)